MHIKNTEYGSEAVYNDDQEYYRHQETALKAFEKSHNNLDMIPDKRMNEIKKELGPEKRRSFILDGYKKGLYDRQFTCAPYHTFYCVMCEDVIRIGDDLIIDTVCYKCEKKMFKDGKDEQSIHRKS